MTISVAEDVRTVFHPAAASAGVRVGMIWAQSLDGVIGQDDTMPWSVPADLRYFKQTTMGCPVIMGRKTWQTLGGKPLPGRPAIVVSRSRQPDITAARVVHSPEEAFAAAAQAALPDASDSTDLPMVWVMGGGEIYRLFLPYVDELRVSRLELHCDAEGATLAPRIDPEDFVVDTARSDADWRERSGDARWKLQIWVRR